MEKFNQGNLVYIDEDINWDQTCLDNPELTNGKIIQKYIHYEIYIYDEIDNTIFIDKTDDTSGGFWYPAQCFKKVTPLKIEINKLKNIILHENICLENKEDYYKFLLICKKLHIIVETTVALHFPIYTFYDDITKDNCIKFINHYKDLEVIYLSTILKPFNKFKNEIL